MFGGLKSKIDEHFYGYREIRPIDLNSYELPNPYLLRYLTSGNKQKAAQHVNEIYAQAAALLDDAMDSAAGSPVSEPSARKIVDAFLKSVNDEGRAKVADHHAELFRAVSVGHHLARSDAMRIGENPPVATGLHIEALSRVAKRFGDDVGWAAHYCAHQVFYMVRRGLNLETAS
jgi:hypothetical protein